MPQNSIIRADGTGDYTSLLAWEAAEQDSDYGDITTGLLDGFFDMGSSQFIIGGTWPNGARITCFNPDNAFNGVERRLCGITGSNTFVTLRTTIAKWEIDGLEIYNTSTGGSHRQTTVTATNVVVNNVLSKTVNGASSLDVPANVSTVTNTVLVGTRSFNNAINGNNITIFADTSFVGGSGSSSLSNTVIANATDGTCYRSSVTQSNNAATDSTADAFDNIVVADNFVNSDPVTSGDYRVKSGSLLATNNIGAFIQSDAPIVESYDFTASIGFSSDVGALLTKSSTVSGEINLISDVEGQLIKSTIQTGQLSFETGLNALLSKVVNYVGSIGFTFDLSGTFAKTVALESYSFSGEVETSLGLSGKFYKSTNQSGVINLETGVTGVLTKSASYSGSLGFGLDLSGTFYTDDVDLYSYSIVINGILVEQKIKGVLIEQDDQVFNGVIANQVFNGELI